MNDGMDASANRRDFLTGRSLQREIVQRAATVGDALLETIAPRAEPKSGPMVSLSTRAMACDFSAFLNAGPQSAFESWHASSALDVVHQMEDLLTVYRESSALLTVNRSAFPDPVVIEPVLADVIERALEVAHLTDGAFDPTSMPLVRLWKHARSDNRIPTQAEIDSAKERTGYANVVLSPVGCDSIATSNQQAVEWSRWNHNRQRSIVFRREGLELQLNAIGKGYALDQAANLLTANGVENWLLHGGHSSVLARGRHHDQDGWPIGIRNPWFPDERLATVVLKNAAMGTSGNSVQFYRWNGQRYGHILDPRTGWPADALLQATVIAPTAAEADALSTAFFVMGLEKARLICQNRPAIGALLIPFPRTGRVLEPVNCGIPAEQLFFAPTSNVAPSA